MIGSGSSRMIREVLEEAQMLSPGDIIYIKRGKFTKNDDFAGGGVMDKMHTIKQPIYDNN